MMNGTIAPDAGTIKQADNLRIVTFSQHRDDLVATQTLQEALDIPQEVMNALPSMAQIQSKAAAARAAAE